MPRNEQVDPDDPLECAVTNVKSESQYQSLKDFSRDEYKVLNEGNDRRSDEHVGITDEMDDPQGFDCQSISRYKDIDSKDTSEYAMTDTKGRRQYQSLKDFNKDEYQTLIKGKTDDMAGYTEARSVVSPSRFYGKPGDDVETFPKEFDRAACANMWSEERKAEILPTYLREFAADFWNDLNDRIKYDYDHVTATLRENFLPKETKRLFYKELYNYNQKPGEPVEEFARIIQGLTLRAHMDMPHELQFEFMREHFIRGLRSSLKKMVMSKDPVTFEEAVGVAKAEECIEELSNGKSDVSSFPTVDLLSANKSASQEQTTVAAVQLPTAENVMQSMLETLMKKMETMIDEKMEKFNALIEEKSDSANKSAPANRWTNRDKTFSKK